MEVENTNYLNLNFLANLEEYYRIGLTMIFCEIKSKTSTHTQCMRKD